MPALLKNWINEKLEWQPDRVRSTDWCRTTEGDDRHEQRAHHRSKNPTHQAEFSRRGCAQSKTGLTEASEDSLALCDTRLGEQGKPIYSKRSKADPHKRWASSPNGFALCGKRGEMLPCGAIYRRRTVLHIPQHRCCWLRRVKTVFTRPTNTLLLGSSFRAFLSVWMASLHSPCKARTLERAKMLGYGSG